MNAIDCEQEREKRRQVKAAERALTAMQHVHESISAYCSAPAIGEFGAAAAAADAAVVHSPTRPPGQCGLTTHSPLHQFLGPH
jgi:hypothetical protein